MKIRSADATPYLQTRVTDKRDAGTSDQGHRHGFDSKKNPHSDAENATEKFEVSEDEVQSTLDAFGKNEQIATQGLHAETQGSGPGLRVILKDGEGRFVRQMTGDEFVKLKENLTDTQGRPGKILDQKL